MTLFSSGLVLTIHPPESILVRLPLPLQPCLDKPAHQQFSRHYRLCLQPGQHARGPLQGEVQFLCQATLGGLLDRWRRKPVLLVATGILTAVSAAFVGTSHLGWHVYGLRFLQGAALAIFTTSNLTLIGELAPPNRRAEAVGIYGAAGLVAVALGPALGEFVLRA
jgi:hypothetical protein